ncbi:MAG: hypothetical protein O3C60_01260 [Planctomycetota bacterium]|nr:hypothetical protein [Planctomycetota bacterium]
MSTLDPIYRRNNCCFCAPLQWGLSVFWRMLMCDDTWIDELRKSTENDGIRILGHQFAGPATSQFAISTKPHVSPRQVVQRIKGRLQNLLKIRYPRSWRRNFAIRSVGHVSRTMIERYVASQLDHNHGDNQRLKERLHEFQVENAEIDLSIPSTTAHGKYWYNLHIVLVHRERYEERQFQSLGKVRAMVLISARSKGYLLSRAGILLDHVHLTLGCPFEISPIDVTLGFLNNLSYVYGMKPVFQFSGFIGTFGEFTHNALKSSDSSRIVVP